MSQTRSGPAIGPVLLTVPQAARVLSISEWTRWTQTYPLHVVTAWLGNTPKVAERHYLQVRDEDFERPARAPTEPERGAQIRHRSPPRWLACGRKRPMDGKMETVFFEERQGREN